MNKTVIIALISCFSTLCQAQNLQPIERQRAFTFGLGGTWQIRRDDLFSPLRYEGIGGEMHMGAESQSERWFKQFDAWGSYNSVRTYVTKGYNYPAHAFRGGLNYSLLHRIKPDNQQFRWYVGGSVFSNGNGQYYLANVNNELSYDVPTGLAASTFLQKNIRFWRKNLIVSTQMTLPLIAYNLRPTYIGFSNEDFYKAQTGFTYFPQHLQFDWRWSIELPLSNQNKIRLTYRWEYLDDRQIGRLQLGTQTVLFQTLFNIPFKTSSKN
ncbi:MAG: hypothetical protein JNL70_14430 [Saprospiraceae bacterium]|nr:hypothetical protein [Saprospiraceae bacterium]